MSVAKDIIKKIEQSIDSTSVKDEFSKKWEVLEIKDWVATVVWLENVMFSEIVEFENWTKWLVLDLSPETVWILVMGDYADIQAWWIVKSTWRVLSVWVWEEFLGRVVDGLWEPIDGKWKINFKERYPLERIAPWVITRKSVDQPLATGIKPIDSMIPVWRWQRELIIWDRQTGKTTVAIDTILNQKWKWVYCIYVAIWQKDSKIRRIVETLKEQWAMDYTIIVNAPASSPAVMQYIAPMVWCAFWEYFMFNNKDALIIYDDLSKHAVAYREVSLLLRRPPGREAYPGDVFYLHSRLLERSARVDKQFGWGSLTALPIIETQAWDVSAYIPTNVISITDWQIFLEANLFNSGVRPAINVWLSVSRVWGTAQTKLMKKVSWKLRLELATFRELAAFAQFASDLDESTQNKIERWKRLTEILKQAPNSPLPFYKQAALIYAGINWYLDKIDVSDIREFEKNLYEKLDTKYKDFVKKVEKENALSDEIEKWFQDIIQETAKEMWK